MGLGKGFQRRGITRSAEQADPDHRPAARADPAGGILQIHGRRRAFGARIQHIHKNRPRPGAQDTGGGGDKGIGRHQNLVARPDPQAREREIERVGGGIHGHGMGPSGRGGGPDLEAGDLRSGEQTVGLCDPGKERGQGRGQFGILPPGAEKGDPGGRAAGHHPVPVRMVRLDAQRRRCSR